MNSFLVSLVFQVQTENHRGLAQFDEQLRIIMAENLACAWEKAKELGKKEQSVFFNQRDQKVIWTFVAPSFAYPLGGLEDGEKVFSLTHESEDEVTYLELIREKSRLAEEYLNPTTRKETLEQEPAM